MRDLTEDNVTEAVLAKMADMEDQRLKEVLGAAVRHAHAFAREVNLTLAELIAANVFLTAIGKKSDETRHEFLLLSDTLGLTILVDAMENRKPAGATETSVLGPFYRADAPLIQAGDNIERSNAGGNALFVSGKVKSLDGSPIEGAMLDFWQGAENGFYENVDADQPDMNLRGRILTAKDGSYSFQSVLPCSYPVPDDGPVGQMLDAAGRHIMRAAHIHYVVSAPGHKSIITEVFKEGDEYIDSDAVFGVKESLIADFVPHDDAEEAARRGVGSPFYTVDYDFVLEPGEGGGLPDFSAGGST
jgi:protocatechuate 3,4-dioxygenase beta subunit